ncbi:GNAT family N-acetyltransferase, partial [Asanoa iriomotensis]
LKELYVAESKRRSGIGGQLMRAVFTAATENECSRVEWQTELANAAARAFYSYLGGKELEGKVLYRVES